MGGIVERVNQENRHKKYRAEKHQGVEPTVVLEMHEVSHHEARLDGGDQDCDRQVKRPQMYQRDSDSKRSQQHQRDQNTDVQLPRRNMRMHFAVVVFN